MKTTFEIRANLDEQRWSLRIDGHEWENDLTTADVARITEQHIRATMTCAADEAMGEISTEAR